jgi:hypothetical protein
MRSIIIIIAFLCFASIAISQELPPDPNKIQAPPGHADPDPVLDPSNLPRENNNFRILYNNNKQKSKEGIFKDNRLCDGNAFIYDDKGKLLRIAKYKNCVFVGDSLLKN